MVVGQQFKWNIVYPGPDGKLGPLPGLPQARPTSAGRRPGLRVPQDVTGPALLPEAQARNVINAYIDQRNPLGKDFTDPDGKDDDWQRPPGRTVYLPRTGRSRSALAART